MGSRKFERSGTDERRSFRRSFKRGLQELDEQIEVEKPSEQALMLMLKQAKEKEKNVLNKKCWRTSSSV
ncbi:hypothetical protein OE903_18050 [Bacillus sp. B6(2022)]|nr:hypothetical protein [Bacillus sp. B6(2022)]